MATMRALLILLPPISVLLVLAVRNLCRAAARNLGALARVQFACLPSASGGSSSFRHQLSAVERKGAIFSDEVLRVAPYKKKEEEEEETSVECVVCLTGIEEGDEIRELKCRHLFHRSCLDRWLARPVVATCPLCRSRLLTPAEEEDHCYDDGEEMEEESSDMMLFMACVHGSSSWFWPS